MRFYEFGDRRVMMPTYSAKQTFLTILIFSWTIMCVHLHRTTLRSNDDETEIHTTAELLTTGSTHIIVVTLNATSTTNKSRIVKNKDVTVSAVSTKEDHSAVKDFIVIPEVYDTSTEKFITLSRPIEIMIDELSSPVVNYPLRYSGKMVNNYAYEDVISKDNDRQYTGCNPGSCGPKVTTSQESHQITKGFCCHCQDLEDSKYQTRGGQDCSSTETPDHITDHDAYHASTHCLLMDDLWYQVYELGQPRIEHMIKLNVDTGRDNSLGKGFKIEDFFIKDVEIGITQPVHFKNNETFRVTVTYAEKHSNVDLFFPINFGDKVVLIPDPSSTVQPGDPQTQLGAYEYLVVNKSDIVTDGSQCNKMGVSYQAFINQEDPCNKPLMTCLENQPYDAWFHDVNEMAQGKKGRYFAGFYGDLLETNLSKDVRSPGSHSLVYQYPHNYSYLVEIVLRTEVTKDEVDSEETEQTRNEEGTNCERDSCETESNGQAEVSKNGNHDNDDSRDQVADSTAQTLNEVTQYLTLVAESLHDFSSLTHIHGILATLILLLLLLVVALVRRCMSKVPKRLENANGYVASEFRDKNENKRKSDRSKETLGTFSDEEVERLQPVTANSKSKGKGIAKSIENSTQLQHLLHPTSKKQRRDSTDSRASSSSRTSGKGSRKHKSQAASGKSQSEKVYLNLRGTHKQIENSGQQFSLYGVVRRSGQKQKPYKFEVCENNNLQFYEMSKGKKKKLSKPRPLDTDFCARLLTEAECEKFISSEPQHACLNTL